MAKQRNVPTGKPEESAREAVHAAEEVARAKAQTLFETNKQAIVSNSEAVTQVLRSASEELADEHEPIARLARNAADKVEAVCRNLQQKSLDATIDSVESYARRESGMFLGGAFLAGLAAARFLKASGERRRTGDARSLPVPMASPRNEVPIPVDAPY